MPGHATDFTPQNEQACKTRAHSIHGNSLTVQPRQDTGLYNAKVGIWLFLASEVMLFGALFSSYILLRVGAGRNWPHGLLNIPHRHGQHRRAHHLQHHGRHGLGFAEDETVWPVQVFQACTVLCALTFLGIKSYEYHEKFIHYEVWKTDGTRVTGHIEGNPMFLTLEKVKAQGGTKLISRRTASLL